MSELDDWLKQFGLETLAGVLGQHDIDLEILADLTDADFEKIGISLGNRRKLLKAIATRHASPAEPSDPNRGKPTAAEPVPAEAERRQVTVLFSDLVGSTALANAIDPEDMSGLIRRYQDACAGAIARFDGYVAKFMGDGVLAYFGYPQAHEDSAERSARAALAIIDAVSQIARPGGRSLETRVGIATGLVVVGDIVGSGAAREEAIVGETPNLAARLQALAEPNTVLVSQSTYHLLDRRFEYQSRGQQALKGFTNPVPVWQVVREAAVTSRFAAARALSLGPFVGRSQEMELLLERWRQAQQGEGQAIVLTAEPGMGKSRLLDALFDRIGDEPHRRIVTQASPYYSKTAFFPVSRQLEHAADFASDDPADVKLDKLDALFAKVGRPGASIAPLVADLLSLSVGQRYPRLELTPAQRKAATVAALVDHLLYLSEQAPVLFVLEDAHWVDPSTLDLLTRLIDSIERSRVLMIITARPEFVSPWAGRDHVASLALSRLGKRQCAELVAGLATQSMMSTELLEEILAKTDGVPLFVEELTRTVTETSVASKLSVPATLQDSLMARLDRLGPAKEIAQVASVIGRQFPQALLAAVTGLKDHDLEMLLARLSEAGLVFPQTRATEPTYIFKHALTRDVAYDSLLRTRRQQLHQRLARTVETQFPALAEAEPEVLAYHFATAGLSKEACFYSERAGDRAVARWAYAEAAAHFQEALAQCERLPEAEERKQHELALLLKQGPVILVYRGLRAPETGTVYQRAYDIAKSLGGQHGLFKALWGLWFCANLGRERSAQNYAEELVALARQSGDEALFLEAIHCRWSTAFFRGDVHRTLSDGAEGVKLYDAQRHNRLGAEFGGHDPGVCAFSCMALAFSQSGKQREAIESLEQALTLAERLNQPSSQTHAIMNATTSYQIMGDRGAVLRHAQQLADIADRLKLAPQRAIAMFMAGWATASGENFASGCEVMESEYPAVATTGPLPAHYAALLAEVRLASGQPASALEPLDAFLRTVKEPGVGVFLPEVHRLRGECLLHLDAGNRDEALRELEQAIAVARQQQATLYEQRAAKSLANAVAANPATTAQ